MEFSKFGRIDALHVCDNLGGYFLGTSTRTVILIYRAPVQRTARVATRTRTVDVPFNLRHSLTFKNWVFSISQETT
jgi:hypothetical protein